MKPGAREVLLVLPLAVQNGIDEHEGIMRFVNERAHDWNIRIDRLAGPGIRPSLAVLGEVDGAIIDGEAPMHIIRGAVNAGIPVVAIDWRHPELASGRKSFVRIDSDSASIGRMAAEALFENCQNATFAVFAHGDDIPWSAGRKAAFRKALEKAGRKVTSISPRASLTDQLRALKKPAAVFAVTDVLAEKILSAAAKCGIRVPEELSVLGVDNDRYTCIHTRPPLASIHPDFREAGYRAAESLQLMLDGGGTRNRRIICRTCELVRRRSMEPPSSSGRLVQRAQEMIRDRGMRDIGMIADRLRVSRRLLDMRFREITGSSVLDYIQEARLGEICHLLSASSASVTEICRLVQLGSNAYLSRFFKRRMGITMSEYRRIHGGPGKETKE